MCFQDVYILSTCPCIEVESSLRIFHSYANVTITCEGLKNFTYACENGQWSVRFLSMPHTLWYGIYVYNGHCRGPVTLTTVTEHLPVDLSLAVLTSRGSGAVDYSVPASGRLSVPRRDSPGLLKQVVTAPLPNAGQHQWMLWVIGNDHYKRMSHVTVGVMR